MYNVPQKEMYISDCLSKSTTKNVAKRHVEMINFFNRLEELEIEFDKDFSMFEFEEVMLALSVLCRRTVKYQITIISNLRKYLQWCIENKCSLDTENTLVCISPNNIDFSLSYKMCMLKDEEQLEEYLDIIFRPLEYDSVDNLYRVICHLMFHGISFYNTFHLKKKQCDLSKKTINIGSNNIILSDKCCKIIKYYLGMDCFVSSIGNGNEKKMEIIETEFLINRSVISRDSMKISMATSLCDKFKDLKMHLDNKISITPNEIWLSGVFYRMYVQEAACKEINFDEYVTKFQDSNNGAYTPSIIINTCKLEYTHWKKAFDL